MFQTLRGLTGNKNNRIWQRESGKTKSKNLRDSEGENERGWNSCYCLGSVWKTLEQEEFPQGPPSAIVLDFALCLSNL